MRGKSMKELCESDELKTFFDRRLIEALRHPVREHILAVLNERIASASEIAEELGADVSSFYHHVEELERLGCIERVETKRRRGAKEHFFKATRTFLLEDEAWQRLPASLRADLITSAVQSLFDEVVTALDVGTFHQKGDEHVTWIPGRLDVQGWKEATDLLEQTRRQVTTILEESAERLAKSGEEGLTATVGMLAFETPKRNEVGVDSGKVVELERGPSPSSARLVGR
jgi:predicted transcriptional regulator